MISHSRSIATSLSLVFVLAAAMARAGDPQGYADPSLEVFVDYRTLKSEEVPRSLYKAMGLGGGPWWYFAKYDDSKVSGRRYLMVAGNAEYWLDTTPPTKAKNLEAQDEVLYFQDGKYQSVDNVGGFSDPADHLPERVIMGLYQDLIDRLIRQLGSAAAVDKGISESWRIAGGKAAVDRYLYRVLDSRGIKNMCVYYGEPAEPGMRICAKRNDAVPGAKGGG
ncbi:MAG TPA: hypothetical protein VFK21_00675 [Gammaproteobacteria bacterium]|nr:hypothetical protein [Gammaproteobacteria bacterium]